MHKNEIVEKLQQEIKKNNLKIKTLKIENRNNKIACLMLFFQFIVFLTILSFIFQSLFMIHGLFLSSILTMGIVGGAIGIVVKVFSISKLKILGKDMKKFLKGVMQEDKKTIDELTIKNSFLQKEMERAKKYVNGVDEMTVKHLLHLETMLDEYIARKKYYRSKYQRGLLFTTNLNIEETSLMEEIIYEDMKIKTRGRLK